MQNISLFINIRRGVTGSRQFESRKVVNKVTSRAQINKGHLDALCVISIISSYVISRLLQFLPFAPGLFSVFASAKKISDN